jgi:hypothetical protein
MLRAPLLILVSLLLPLATQAQTQASCTFKFFSLQTTITLPDGTPVFLQPLGIDDFGTVVGYGHRGSAGDVGLIRWANGGFNHVTGTRSLNARNDNGTMVGSDRVNETFRGILVNGQTITPIVLDVNNSGVVFPTGINKWGTIVGIYGSFSSSHGFKRWSNGTTHTLDFPGAQPASTSPAGLNDLGTVVGTYRDATTTLHHGFIFHNGQWATLDYPHASDTRLFGITNAGQIIGSAGSLFLYENGTFKVISVPNSAYPELLSISPKQGLILGRNTATQAFTAKCQ